MRYRLYKDEEFLGTIIDRPAFHNRFEGNDPNSPKAGDKITYEDVQYTITIYFEFESESFTENEFHEKETEWFADVQVK